MRVHKNSLNKCVKFQIEPFVKSNKGNVAIIFGLAIIPILISVGISVDYMRASDTKAAIQAAVDSASLAAALDKTATDAQKTLNAQASVISFLSSKPWVHITSGDIGLVHDITDGSYQVTANAKIDTSIMNVIGVPTMDIGTLAKAIANTDKKLEIALALDNTGSMASQGIIDLKAAAKQFITKMNPVSSSDKTKIGLVPFVAVVNPGKAILSDPTLTDYTGEADYHGYYFAAKPVTIAFDCNPNPGYGSGSDPGVGGLGWLDDEFGKLNAKFASAVQQVLGISTAHAQVGAGGTTTPTDYATISTAWQNHNFPSPNLKSGSSGFVMLPLGKTNHDFSFNDNTCYFFNPARINHFDLFARTGNTGVPWKGCVMARKEPYDMDDSAPVDSIPNTKFVPYFYPSDPPRFTVSGTHYGFSPTWTQADINDPANEYKNNYMPYGPAGLDRNGTASDPTDAYIWANFYYVDPSFSISDILKYNKTNNGLTIPNAESGPNTIGPNRACPNEVTPLTNDSGLLNTQIDAMVEWNGGGTVTSEGLMWAWRILSPNKPYATALNYTDPTVQKYIILMTDGVNNVDNAGPPVLMPAGESATAVRSEQTAYGAYWEGSTFAPQYGRDGSGAYPVPINNFPSANSFLDDRFRQACSNAQAKGIKVFAIYFSHDSYGTHDDVTAAANARQYLKDCSGNMPKGAGAGVNFYDAKDAAQLKAAFDSIASSILTGVRLVK